MTASVPGAGGRSGAGKRLRIRRRSESTERSREGAARKGTAGAPACVPMPELRRAAILMCALLCAAAAGGCGKRRAVQEQPPPARERPQLGVTIKRSETVQEDERGRPMWRILAEETELDQAAGRATVRRGEVEVFGEKERRLMLSFQVLTANAEARRLHARGAVTAKSEEADAWFRADSVTVDLKTDRVVASGNVQGSNPAGSFQADRLETDLNLSRIRLTSSTRVTAVIGIPERLQEMRR